MNFSLLFGIVLIVLAIAFALSMVIDSVCAAKILGKARESEIRVGFSYGKLTVGRVSHIYLPKKDEKPSKPASSDG